VKAVDSPDGRFRIQYTTEGEDAPSGGLDEDGVPLMVQRVLDGLALGEETFIKRGYRGLVADDGTGGSDAIDVYLTHLDSNGYANADTPAEGTNSSCFIRVDNGLGGLGGAVVESVAIHELHHCIQFVYTTEGANWVYEATATFEQYRALSDETLQLALDVLYIERLNQPDWPLAYRSGRFHYAAFVWIKFWEEFGGVDEGRAPALWEQLSLQPAWKDALHDEAKRVWGLGLDEVFLEHATWNAFACAGDNGEYYSETLLPCKANVRVPIEEVEGAGSTVRVNLEEHPFTAAYALRTDAVPDTLGSLRCSGPTDSAAEVWMRLLGLDASGGVVEQQQMRVSAEGSDVGLTVQAEAYLAVFASTGEAPIDISCVFEESEAPEEGCGCNSVGGLAPLGLGILAGFGTLWARRRP